MGLLTLSAVLAICSWLFAADRAAAEKPSELSKYDARIKESDRKHWAFQPVRRPGIPTLQNTAWAHNPIDAFVLARLEARGWQPAVPASPRALLRRIYLDVTGLPPTIEEQDDFLRNPSPEQYARLVDNLLARPAYGERWARHWLDLVRYAESNGYERDAAKPYVWRYRDYVIRAFNHDKPFDRFLLEQLAGDELPDANAETVIASGYHRLGPWDDEPADPQEDRFDQLDDMVSTTSLAFLGLSLGCARCHDHKFDPVTQLDYYRMAAIFAPLRRPQADRTELTFAASPPAQMKRTVARESSQRVASGFSRSISGPLPQTVALLVDRQFTRRSQEQGYFLWEPSPAVAPMHLLIRGKASRPGPEVPPGVPAVLVPHQPDFLLPDKETTRRRLTLARWIASPENPLTARVIVNRVWQWHFGEGLVSTPSDFGFQGAKPSHPELLDWLADRFVREGWSLKKLHRLILTSNTYRMSKTWNARHGAQDPLNQLLWRFPYHRLDVETIRDSMLAVSGRLNRKMYGPSMYPEVPKEVLEGSSDPDKIWKPYREGDASRRTIYAFIKRSMVVPFLEVLDVCDTARSSARRAVTTVAPQALTLFNGSFVQREAEHFAERIQNEVGSAVDGQIQRAYLLALSRPPSKDEVADLKVFLERTESHRALVQMCRVIFNLNEFVYPD
jgi:hypothetical protein